MPLAVWARMSPRSLRNVIKFACLSAMDGMDPPSIRPDLPAGVENALYVGGLSGRGVSQGT